MPPFRPPKERVDSLVDRIAAELARTPSVTVVAPNDVRAIIRATLMENLEQEHAIEQEVLETLQAHGQKIYEQHADFPTMVQEGKKMVARKKGFTL